MSSITISIDDEELLQYINSLVEATRNVKPTDLQLNTEIQQQLHRVLEQNNLYSIDFSQEVGEWQLETKVAK